MEFEGKRSLRSKMVKVIYYEDSEESSDQKEDSDYEYDDEDDSDYDSKKRKNKKAKMNESSDEDSRNQAKTGGQKSEYEQMIEKNRAEKMAFLQSLNIDEAKSSLRDAVNTVTKKNARPNTKRFKKIDYTTLVGHRKSTRLADVNIDLSEEGLSGRAYEVAKLAEKKERLIPESTPFKDVLDYEERYQNYVEDVDIQESKAEFKFASYDKPMLTNLTLDTTIITSIISNRLTSLVWYPDPEYLVIASGNSLGNVGVWNINSKPFVFKPHVGVITNLQFNPFNRIHMFSSSSDGALSYGDMVKHVFNEVYIGEDKNTSFTHFDFLSESTYLIAQNNGEVVIVDNRAGKNYSPRIFKCHDCCVKFVNVHPVNRSYFITSAIKGAICLWDLRKLHNKFVADIGHHTRSVHSSFFSPVTGNSILTTSVDSISIYNSTDLTDDIKLKKVLRFKVSGKKHTSFRAAWLPNSEEAFYISDVKTARSIKVYDKNMNVYHEMGHDFMHAIVPTNAFHPCRPAVAGATPSGKVYVYK